ncbi:FtsX-like permease family protein [Saccharopolyspora hattusasensis]|uniref:FtsX-like permease family protein n=1 Tax=Saccharopolyspora hattusasensis TaxID=1128679 RepID=UPI003D96C4ED
MTGLSVLVASFMVFGAVLARDMLVQTALDTFSDTPRATSVVVSSSGKGLSPDELAAIRGTPGVAEAAGRLETTQQIGSIQRSNLTLVADPGAGPLSKVRLVSGTYPASPGQIALDRRTAGHLAIDVGARLTLGNGERPTEMVVTGVVEGPVESEKRAYATDRVVATLLDDPEPYERVDIRAVSEQQRAQLINDLDSVLGVNPEMFVDVTPGEVVRNKEARESAAEIDKVFTLIAMFVAVSVGAAALVATSTFRIVFAQRMRQLALLRTLGAQRGQLVRALAAEGAVVGLVAGTLGVLAAYGAGYAAPAIAGATGITVSAPGVPITAAFAVVIGAALTTVAAVLAPAYSAARVAPLQALRSSNTMTAERRIGPLRLVLGLLLVVWSIGAAAYPVAGLPGAGEPDYDTDGALLSLVLSGSATFGALIALGPAIVGPVLAAVSWPLRKLSHAGRLAVSSVGGTPHRAAGVSVVVALGVTLVVGTVVGTACLQSYVDEKLAARAPADLVVATEGQPFASGIVDRLTADRALTGVTPFRAASLKIGQSNSQAVDLDVSALPESRRVTAAEGTLAGLSPGEAVLGRSAAEDLQVRVGDHTTLRSAGGEVPVTVKAILQESGPLSSDAILVPGDLDKLGTSSFMMLANASAPGADGQAGAKAAIRNVVGASGEVEIGDLADLRDKANSEVSGMAAVALGLLGLTVLIAVVGVGTTAILSVLERTTEVGLLRALGMGRGGLRTMITTEAGLYGTIGAALGVLLGVPYAWLATAVLDLGAPLELPGGQLILVVAVLIAITAMSGFFATCRAARVSPVNALTTPD